jgi:predicted dehydrogenase
MHDPKQLDRRQFLGRCQTAGAAAVLGSMSAQAAPARAKKIRVGVIGCGSVSRMYLPDLVKCPYVKLVSTCDRISERAERAAKEYRVPNHYPKIESMLAGEPFDLFVNLTDMQEHGQLNRQALEADRHVWSEKPLHNSYAEGKALLDFARHRELRIWGAPIVVMSPQFAYMNNAIQAGKLGHVAAAHASYGHLGPDWSAFFYERGGGSMPDLGVYNFTTITGLLGPARSIMAMTSIITPRRNVDDKGEITVAAEDNASVLLDHGNGTISHVQCGFNYFDPYGHGGTGQQRATISIVGKAGSMHLVGYDWAPQGVDIATRNSESGNREVEDAGDYVWQQGASLAAECLATGKEPLMTPEHALHVVEIIEAARESQATGRRIELKSTFSWPLAT